MASITIEGIEIIVSNGRARLSSQGYQSSNPSMWRAGSTQYEVALGRQERANRIISSLNSTGSYVNSAGMRTYINRGEDALKHGQFTQRADPGTEAARVSQRFASGGGIKRKPQSEAFNRAMKVMKMLDAVGDIANDIELKTQAYFDKVSQTTSNIGQPIVNIFTD